MTLQERPRIDNDLTKLFVCKTLPNKIVQMKISLMNLFIKKEIKPHDIFETKF